jgi:hypothetical protein
MGNLRAGLGAARRALRTKSFTPFADGSAPVLESAALALTHLLRSPRAELWMRRDQTLRF